MMNTRRGILLLVAVCLGIGLGSFGVGFAQSVPDSWVFWPARLEIAVRGYGEPEAITSGDFNGDGFLDIATANYGANAVSVVLATGTGLFGSPNIYASGPSPISIVCADFNGDTYLDLATANSSEGYAALMSVLMGNGDGSFETNVNYMCRGENPTGIACADFNEDTHPDLAVTVQYGSGDLGNVSIFLNQGDGTFGEWPSSPVYYSLSGRPFALTTVDLNEDGHSDLVVARISANMMSVMLGTGNGVFDDPVDFPVASPSAITHADVNEDGHED
ncbi:MAG: VCBS repeat-containing protein, partial [bacterium]|nr:VCBS repeat-containing protein [bacterium]